MLKQFEPYEGQLITCNFIAADQPDDFAPGIITAVSSIQRLQFPLPSLRVRAHLDPGANQLATPFTVTIVLSNVGSNTITLPNGYVRLDITAEVKEWKRDTYPPTPEPRFSGMPITEYWPEFTIHNLDGIDYFLQGPHARLAPKTLVHTSMQQQINSGLPIVLKHRQSLPLRFAFPKGVPSEICEMEVSVWSRSEARGQDEFLSKIYVPLGQHSSHMPKVGKWIADYAMYVLVLLYSVCGWCFVGWYPLRETRLASYGMTVMLVAGLSIGMYIMSKYQCAEVAMALPITAAGLVFMIFREAHNEHAEP